MDEATRAQLFSFVAFRMASNEDEFGIFCQGVAVGITVAQGSEAKPPSNILEEYADDESLIRTGVKLMELFLAGKRMTESIAVNFTPTEKTMRNMAVTAARNIVEGRGKADA
jgi:hypothetical protein